MATLPIRGKPPVRRGLPLFSLGFRPFFLGASAFSVLTIGLWMAAYVFRAALPLANLSTSQWHAHEMIYGYSLAVIAGFLLTAVRNWTRLPTPQGIRLALLFSLWALARLLYVFGTTFIIVAGVLDLLFILFLSVAVLSPIVRTRQWRQLAIGAKLLFLALGHVAFYLGAAGFVEQGVYWGLYGGLYLVIGLIMTMGARVIPSFIRNGVGMEEELPNPRGIAVASLILYLGFFIAELFVRRPALTAVLAGGLFVVTTIRLFGWHHPGIWKRPLLWSLFISFLFIDLGFLLFALSPIAGFSRFVAVHAMTVGGIGLITMGMMARVSLGHSGRNIHRPPRTLLFSFLALVLAAVVRVIFPLAWPDPYVTWIGLSQGLWIAAFLLFLGSYGPILLEPDAEPA